jgi:hypothetical protein
LPMSFKNSLLFRMGQQLKPAHDGEGLQDQKHE